MTLAQLFAAVGLVPIGRVPWKTPIPEKRPNVYIVASRALFGAPVAR